MTIDREKLGELIYRAMYEHHGGLWRCVETREVWFEIADRLLEASQPAGDVGELVAKARNQWNDWMRQPDNSSDPIHIEALIAWANSRPAGAFVLLADALTARAERLEAALRPFAEIAEHDIGESDSDSDNFLPMHKYNRGPVLTVGLFRAARAIRAANFNQYGEH